MSFLNRFLPDRPRDDTLASIVRNLNHTLNSRRGYGSLLCDLGIGDFLAQQGGRNTALTLLSEVRGDIERFEPRLHLFELRTLGRDPQLRLCIEVRGEVAGGSGSPKARPTACKLHILFHAVTGAVEVTVAE